MSKMFNMPKKEEIVENEEEEKQPIFEENNDDNVEEKKEIEKSEPIDIPKTKRTKTMTDKAQKQLNDARAKSIATRKAIALKKKQEKEQKELTNQKYINEIDTLKKQLEEMKNRPQQEKIVEKIVYKEKEDNDNYKFSLDDLEFYANEKIKKLKEMEDEVKFKRKEQMRNKYMYNLR
jgi:hypothetical protein